LRKGLFDEGYQIYRFQDDKLIGALEGPPYTFSENGFFLFEIIFPLDYIIRPPKFVFKTKIFHPNINELGIVSLDILQNNWSAAIWTFDIIILSVQSLLDDPNPDDYINEEAAKLLKEDKIKYGKTVQSYTSKYAKRLIFEQELRNLNLHIVYINKDNKNPKEENLKLENPSKIPIKRKNTQ
jgi:ubiquitin-conjugating enzyme E2 D/E